MRIAICGSLSFYKEIEDLKVKLKELGHEVEVPHTEYGDFHEIRKNDEKKWRSLKSQFMKDHFNKIKKSDAIIVFNSDKRGIKNYIGGNTLFEIGLAFELGKKIFLFNPIPMGMNYTEELEVIDPIVINGNLKKIR